VVGRDDTDRIRARLLELLAEDAHNAERLGRRLDQLARETGIEAHSALLLVLTHLAFDEAEARRHWDAIVAHVAQLSATLSREVGIRVAALDYFLNVNRHLVQPTLIDIEMLDAGPLDAGVDETTGLVSDRRLRTALQTELRRARRYRQKASVVLIDVDDFRDVNERCGVLVGDRLLRELAIVLKNNVRDIDVAGRPGEDEMALVLPETDRNGALLVAERFRREAETFFARREAAGGPVGLTVSAGVACYPDDATTAELLLERAAQALYQAKATGKNAVHLYHPERRRYLRFELEPGRFEVEVLIPADRSSVRARNLSRSGILFSSPEPLEVGEEIEIRLAEPGEPRSLRLRGRVVRLEELPVRVLEPAASEPAGAAHDRFDVGVALDLDWAEGTDQLLDFLEAARRRKDPME
jgi:diguanylate cyclase (GGDEF)-like protein